ncbi:MAG: hypothetical protein R2707_08530 [Acidimicrobiales bacterium]
MAGRLIAVLAASLLVASACAEPAPPTLEVGSLEAALPASAWPDDPSIVTDVACPELDTSLIAQTTVCTAVLDADTVTVDVVIDEFGAATAGVREPLFVVAEAADRLVERLRDDLSIEAISAQCAAVVIIAEPGRSFACAATSGDRTIDFDVVLGREAGAWELRLAG